MRAMSLRVKINAAILLAFVAAAAVFAGILASYMDSRQAAAQNRTRTLLGVLAVHRLEALEPLLGEGRDLPQAQDILDHLTLVEGVTEASLFTADGRLAARAGLHRPAPLPLLDSQGGLPTQRVFTVSADGDGRLAASLVEPIVAEGTVRGYLRLRYSMHDISALNHQTWFVFGLAVASAYALLAVLLNIMLHRCVLHPVEVLRQGLEAVEAGRLGHMLPVVSGDALGRMAMAFNAMSVRLKETSASLARSRAEIEENGRQLARRVEERTAELARTNARLQDEVAARREAEARLERSLALYQAILESKTEGVLGESVEPDREVLTCNGRFLELWGLAADWAVQNHDIRQRQLCDRLADPEAVRSAYEALVADPWRLDVAVLSLADGRFLQRRSAPIVEGATPIGRVFSYVDVTEERKRQARTERDRDRAEDASRAKGAFLAVMSHEIRTPLNVVIGLTEELLAGPGSDEQRNYLRTIQESAAHLLDVVNDVLDFSKIEAGKLILERGEVDMRRIIDSLRLVFGHEATRKGLAFQAAVDAAVPARLCGDAGRLRQVLVNLVGNAIKFTEKGSVTVTASLADPETRSDGTFRLVIRVADTGIGIDEAQQTRLFKDFEQGPGHIARRYGGTGLGLAIAKGIVTRMGGSIEVQTKPGEGSVFTVRIALPRYTGDVAAETAAVDVAPVAVTGRLHILLVEDNALNAAVTRLHMGRMGHALTVASSAREAYDLLARERFDVVLMDVEMPEIDGITAARTIRAGGEPGTPVLDPAVPIIAVTAHALEDMRQECLTAGMTGFVAKPVNFKTLQRALAAAATGRDQPVPVPPEPPSVDKAVFDPEAARAAMGIDWSQYGELRRVSFEEGVRRLAEAQAAMDAGDMTKAAIAAHTLKGAAATLGAYACRDLASRLDKALRAGDRATADQALAALQDAWAHFANVFAAWRLPDGDADAPREPSPQ